MIQWLRGHLHKVADAMIEAQIYITGMDGGMQTEFELDMHPYGRDKSYRCYHIDLQKLIDGAPADLIDRLWVRVIAN